MGKLQAPAILELLVQESDENHTLAMSNLVNELDFQYGITAERHSLGRKINSLNDDYDIGIEYDNANKGYRLTKHLFTRAEQFMLCNALHAATFVNKSISDELIKKILSTGSRYYKAEFQSIIFHPNPRKVENEQLMQNMDTVEVAIMNGYKISFDYMHYELDMHMHIKNKVPIIAEPRYITYQGAQAYLIITGGRHKGFMVYRFDKIANAKIIKEKVPYLDSNMDACEFSNSKLFMYTGDTMNVTFRIKKSKLDLLVDSFGLNIHPHEYNDELYECTVKTTDKAAVIFAQKYIDVVELASPRELREKMRTLLSKAAEMYSK